MAHKGTPKALAAVVGYIRVSTADQAREGVSLEAQRQRIEAWARANGRTLLSVHVDAGLSGKRADNRPALAAALADVTKSEGVLVVYSLSRLSRSTRDAIEIADRLRRAGADLVSLTENIDTTGAAGKMVFQMLAVLAEFERNLVAERTSAALAYKRDKGEAYCRTPFGFDRSGDSFTVNVAEARAITLARRRRAEGRTLREIADELTRSGVPTKRGGKWAPFTVKRLLDRSEAA